MMSEKKRKDKQKLASTSTGSAKSPGEINLNFQKKCIHRIVLWTCQNKFG